MRQPTLPRRRAAPLLLPLAALAIAPGPLCAQDALPESGTLIPIDRVVACINDAVILNSDILTLIEGYVRTARLDRPLERHELRLLYEQKLGEQIDEHALSQAAKTLGMLTPEHVEAIVQQQLRRKEQEQEEQLGSMQRTTDELIRQGRTWEDYEREQRVAIQALLTRQLTVAERLRNQRTLFITPRMMREYYRNNRLRFVHDGFGHVGKITLPDEETARRAAATWKEEPLSPHELVARFLAEGALAPEHHLVDPLRKDVLTEDLYEFGRAGPAGRVSEPIPRHRNGRLLGYQVMKVLEHVPARNAPFEDEEVQAEIRNELLHQVEDYLLEEAIQRARERTHVWRAPDLR